MAQESCAIILPQFIAVCVIALRYFVSLHFSALFVLHKLYVRQVPKYFEIYCIENICTVCLLLKTAEN